MISAFKCSVVTIYISFFMIHFLCGLAANLKIMNFLNFNLAFLKDPCYNYQ